MALADIECGSADLSHVTLVKSLCLSDPHLPVDMAPGTHPVHFYGALALTCAWQHWQGPGYRGE